MRDKNTKLCSVRFSISVEVFCNYFPVFFNYSEYCCEIQKMTFLKYQLDEIFFHKSEYEVLYIRATFLVEIVYTELKLSSFHSKSNIGR